MRIAAIAFAMALLAVACGGGASGGGGAGATTVAVTLTDKEVTLDQANVPAGKVTFAVKNSGTLVHSLTIIKTELDHAKIPQDPKDAGKADEKGKVGAVPQLQVGASKQAALDLAPGTYVLVCNEPAHYLLGMHVGFTVR